MGLGLLGKGLGDAVFLVKNGAKLTITDLKTEKELKPSIKKIRNSLSFQERARVRFALGKHELSDFENRDFILKAQGIPLDSPYIAHARKKGIPIRMDDELFVSLLPKHVKVIGVTGTRGKTTTATLLYEILKKSGKRAHLGGNIRGVATLELLPKIKSGDIVVLELSSWQLQGFHDWKISPHIAIFTNFMHDHMNYYSSRREYFYDKSAIYAYQKKGDICVLGDSMSELIKKCAGRKIIAKASDVPKSWKLPIPGEHNRENIAFAVAVAKILKVPLADMKKGVESFKAVHGRLEFLKKYEGISIYNDNSSCTPEATAVAIKTLGTDRKNIVLIMGGADKGLAMKELLREIAKHCKSVILLPGTGTDKLKITGELSKDLKDAVSKAIKNSEKGDIILFSPAFASFGMFVNYYERNDKFVEIIRKLK